MTTIRHIPSWRLLLMALLLASVGCATHNSTVGGLAQDSPVGPDGSPKAPSMVASSADETPESRSLAATSPAGTGAFEPAPKTAADLDGTGRRLNRIHFGFDSYLLDQPARATLRDNADYLSDSSSAPVRVEGHCDERGSAEYNLALGERRAQSAADYLRDLGVAPQRLQVVSFGEERPLDGAHAELAWASNRRAEFVEITK